MPRPSHVLAALSLLACIALAFAWDQSRSTAHVLGHLAYRTHNDGAWHATGVMFTSAGGAIGAQFATARSTDPDVARQRQAQPPGWYRLSESKASHPRSSGPPRRHELCGFGFARGPFPLSLEKVDDRATAAWVPYWSLLLLTAVLPLRFWSHYRRHHRQRLRSQAGLCPTCAYDLRATPGLCPECGKPATTPACGKERG